MKLIIFLSFFLMCFTALAQQHGAAYDAYVQAERLRKEKRNLDALAAYEKAIKLAPDNLGFQNGKAACYIGMKEYERAKEIFDDMLKKDSAYAQAWEGLAGIAEANKDFATASQNYNKAGETEKTLKNKMIYWSHAVELASRAGSFENALSYLQKAKALDSLNVDILYTEAEMYNASAQYDKVEKPINAALARLQKTGTKPEDLAKYYYELGYAYLKMEQFDKSEKTLKKAEYGVFRTKVYELTPDYQFSVGNAYFKAHEYEKSMQYIETAMKMRTNYKEAEKIYKIMNQSQDNRGKTIQMLSDSVEREKNPTKKSAKACSLCMLQFDAKDYDGVLQSARECLKMNQRNLLIVYYQSVAYHKTGDLDRATLSLDNLSRAPQINDEARQLFNFALGMIYKDAHQPKIAAAYFKKVSGIFQYAAKIEMRLMRSQAGQTPEEETETNSNNN